MIKIEKIIENILEQNKELFGENTKFEKINVGFTNTIYIVNENYVVKICTNPDNEKNIEKEINFYKANVGNNLIPKLYYSNVEKAVVPYYYEIIEKLEGVSLYNVWHTLNESQREDIIKQLCDAMKQFHSNVGESYDWTKKTSELFNNLYDKAKELNLFDNEEQEFIDNAYSKFDKYLETKEFVLVHNDLHFDNIFYNDGKIKLIDFERSIYAPRDFELDILYRMIRKPWKFASEETEEYTKLEDYENIMMYIEKYYPELIHIDNLYKRLAIYDMIYYLKQYINNPHILELKEDMLSAVKIVLE